MNKIYKKVFKKLKNDGDVYYAWQSRIAMAFYDEYLRTKKDKKYIDKNTLHFIANNAAINFLDLLIK